MCYMKKVAVITGASSGLGALFAKEIDNLAENGRWRIDGKEEQIDEFCLIARREDRLQAVANELKHPAIILPFDLTQIDSAASVASALKGNAVSILVNCAGFGRIGTFERIPLKDTDGMIALNCRAAVDLTYSLLPLMAKGSCIINVASVASFQPFQHLAIYAATKAFLLSWSRALHWEVMPRLIHVTALCPYWMRGTEFISHAQQTGTERALDKAQAADVSKNQAEENAPMEDIKHFPFCDDARTACIAALKGAMRNKDVVTCSAIGALHRALCKILPQKQMQGLWEMLRKI